MKQKPTYEELEQRNQLLEQIISEHEEIEQRYSDVIQMIKNTNSGIEVEPNNTLYETPSGVFLNGHYVSNVTDIQVNKCIEMGNTLVSIKCIVSDFIRIGSH